MKKIDIPVVVTGPGSQPTEQDGAELDYLHMEADMSTYSAPLLPEPEEIEGVEDAIALLGKLQTGLTNYRAGEPAIVLSLDQIDERSTNMLNQALGNGEVSVTFSGAVEVRIQESVLAGVWRVQYMGDNERVERDVIEVADIPGLVKEATFDDAQPVVPFAATDIPDGVYNAGPLLTEINGKLPEYRAGSAPHVINLSLLPHTDQDIAFLVDKLGIGPAVILSRGYGNCRISSTATRHVWWVQYFNSQDTLILDTIEISDVPEVACAAQEDIDDSAERLMEILDVYR